MRRRTLLKGAGLCLVTAGLAGFAPPHRAHTATPAARTLADPTSISAVRTRARLVALTFDDGPDPAYTPAVLDVLARYEARATFFMIGRSAAQHPDLVQRVISEGHTVANHTHDHLWLDALGVDAVREQWARGRGALREAGAEAAMAPARRHVWGYARPPRGWTSATVAQATTDEQLRTVFWSGCLESGMAQRPALAAADLAGSSRPGSILLCHDGGHLDGPNPQAIDRSWTVDGLPTLLEGLHRRGLAAVDLRTLVESAANP